MEGVAKSTFSRRASVAASRRPYLKLTSVNRPIKRPRLSPATDVVASISRGTERHRTGGCAAHSKKHRAKNGQKPCISVKTTSRTLHVIVSSPTLRPRWQNSGFSDHFYALFGSRRSSAATSSLVLMAFTRGRVRVSSR